MVDQDAQADPTNGARVILAWLVTLILVAAITRTRAGYTVVYYALWLAIVLLLLGSYKQVSGLLSLVRAPDGPSSEG